MFRNWKFASAYLSLLVSLLLTVVAGYFAYRRMELHDSFRFTQRSEEVISAVDFRIQTYINVLIQTRGFFSSSDSVTRAEFSRYIDSLNLTEKYPGIQGIGFSRYIPANQLQQHEKRIQDSGYRDFRVWPILDDLEIHSIIFIEPFDWRNQRAFGFNMFSEPTRREAMIRARDTGEPAFTGVVTLVQETEVHTQRGFLIYLPYYGKTTPGNLQERRDQLVGFIYSPFRTADLFDATLATAALKDINLEVYLGKEASPENLIYERYPKEKNSTLTKWVARHQKKVTLNFAGQDFILHFLALPSFYLPYASLVPALIFVIGFLVSLLVFRIVWLNNQNRLELAESLAINSRLYQEAENANRAKDEFLATLSHELRTPLNVILGWVDILKSEPYDPENYNQAIEVLERNSKIQVELINDLLDVSRIVSGKLHLNIHKSTIVPVIENALESVRPAAKAKELKLDLNLPQRLPEVYLDPDRIQQVLWNLLTNSVKFTPSGGSICIKVCEKDGFVEVSVTDTGKGIQPQFLPYVFERFHQEEFGTTKTYGGLGLGLAIVRYLVESHGGTVDVTSKGLNQGTTFSFRLPTFPKNPTVGPSPESQQNILVTHAESVSGLAHSQALKHQKILLVDDSPDILNLVRRVLERQGAHVAAASSSTEALTLYDQVHPELIISDIGMPGEDGYTLIKKIREREQDKKVPAIALTAYARDEDSRRALSAGYQKHLAKPIQGEALIAAVIDLLEDSAEGSTPS